MCGSATAHSVLALPTCLIAASLSVEGHVNFPGTASSLVVSRVTGWWLTALNSRPAGLVLEQRGLFALPLRSEKEMTCPRS